MAGLGPRHLVGGWPEGGGVPLGRPQGGRMRTGRAALTGFVLAVATVLGGLWAAPPPVAALAAGHRHPGGWTAERRWSPKNDWEPNIAAPTSGSPTAVPVCRTRP